MNTRQLGTNGPRLTEIGLGAWAIGGQGAFGWGASDDNESIATVQRSLDLGVNWIDTAPVYGHGHSEEVIGRALQGRRDKVFVATKCGMLWDEQKHVRIHLGPESIRREMEASLKRLKTDHVDLYQFHWPDPATPVEDSWQEMVRLKKEGKTRYIGVCNFDVPLLSRCEKIEHVQSLQPIYNMLESNIEKEILPYCLEHGVGVVVYSPMQSGLLTDTFNRSSLAKDDWRLTSERFTAKNLEHAEQIVQRLKPIASRYGKTVAQLAIAWVLMHKAVTSAIVGARRVRHAEQNVGGAGWKIPDKDMAAIEKILA